jgi:chromosomal replication initiation ATPase DnaA
MKKVIFDGYAIAVCKFFNIDQASLFSKSRQTMIVEARQILFYLCYKRPIGLSAIQQYTEMSGLKIAPSWGSVY